MVCPQIHISRKLSHFLTTLCVKAALHFFWRRIFAALAFCIVGVFRLWKFSRGKAQTELEVFSSSVL